MQIPYTIKKLCNTSTMDLETFYKDKDVFIGPKEFVSHMMMTQTEDRHQLKYIYKVYILPSNSKHNESYASLSSSHRFIHVIWHKKSLTATGRNAYMVS